MSKTRRKAILSRADKIRRAAERQLRSRRIEAAARDLLDAELAEANRHILSTLNHNTR